MRELQAFEIDRVAGGAEWIDENKNGFFDEGDTIVVTAGGGSNGGGSTGYWAIGATLGLGLGVWGTSNGNWGIAWNVGIGGYVLAGQADSEGAAIKEVTEEKIVIGFQNPELPALIEIDPRTGEVRTGDIRFGAGLFGTSPEGPPTVEGPIGGETPR